MNSIDFYTKTFRVADCEADFMRRMTPGALLRCAQQIATDHCDSLGLDAAFYRRTHTVFLMARLALEYYRPLCTGDEVTVTTRPSAPVRASYHRTTEFIGPDGALACLVDSRWVLVDTDTRRILRHPPEGIEPFFRLPPARELDVSVAKGDAVPVGQETAVYTRCDSNRHMNNTFYADIVCDHVPLALLERRRVQRLAIVYHNEVPMGARFALSSAALGDGDWYFLGQGEKKHFEAQLTLTPDAR